MDAVRIVSVTLAARSLVTEVAQYVYTQTMNLLSLVNQADSGYVIKNHMLMYPAEWMLDKDVAEAIAKDKPLVRKCITDGVPDDLTPDQLSILPLAQHRGHDIYTMPLFSAEFIKAIQSEIENIKKHSSFEVNPDEAEEVQIEEFVLRNKCPGWYLSMLQLFLSHINVVIGALYGRIMSSGVIQLANYNPRGIQQTSWHHDGDADFTLVVPLNTGEYEGGGTEFFNRGSVPALPNGHALIFPAQGMMHRGMPVESGDRYLLVFWMRRKNDDA